MATEHLLHDKLEQTSNPVAPLALIVLPSAEKLGEKINNWIRYFRLGDHNEHRDDPTYEGYYEQDYRLPVVLPRFSTGEGKAVLQDSTRGKDIYILVDITNYSITYEMNGFTNHMSPDDHFQDLSHQRQGPQDQRDHAFSVRGAPAQEKRPGVFGRRYHV